MFRKLVALTAATSALASYSEELSKMGVEMNGVEVNVEERALVVTEDLKGGSEIISMSLKGVRLASDISAEAKEFVEKMVEVDATVEGNSEYALAVDIVLRPPVVFESVELSSGLDIPDSIFQCLYSDIPHHIAALKYRVDHFVNLATTTNLCSESVAKQAILFVTQSAGLVYGFANSTAIFPVMELLSPSYTNTIEPGGVFLPQEGESYRVTFKISQDVKKGTLLYRTPQYSLFRSAAIFGLVDPGFASVPLELTWGNLPNEAKEALSTHGCGDSAVSLVTRDGGYDTQLEVCIRIAAAYQVAAKTDSEVAKLAGINFAETTDDEIVLGGFDLMRQLFEQHLEKLPKEESCATISNPTVMEMNENIKIALHAAIDKLVEKAETYLKQVLGDDYDGPETAEL
eukprot:TRINITY_DN20158_c0_g1_i1.p1 TRINITY_DN20158_c0_g1~~TRINITY_DN20158_c0_g1_i1.p1  ORF type:complete len:402 (+),score=91.95 TRINITY_DN20158_c0_g1_i1:51-1256(+)